MLRGDAWLHHLAARGDPSIFAIEVLRRQLDTANHFRLATRLGLSIERLRRVANSEAFWQYIPDALYLARELYLNHEFVRCHLGVETSKWVAIWLLIAEDNISIAKVTEALDQCLEQGV